jgi:D-galactarolactone cycloisomerase
MKISGIDAYRLVQPLNEMSFGISQGWIMSRQAVVVVVSTDEGIQGVGETFGPAEAIAKAVDSYVAPMMIGKDPFGSAQLWDTTYGFQRQSSQKGILVEALSAVDIALWDIKGRFTGLPIYQLMGGAYRDKARVYVTGLFRPVNCDPVSYVVEKAQDYQNRGFPAIKLKIGYASPEEDLYIIKAIRDVIGYETKLMIDANCAYNRTQAVEMARRMEPYDVYWFEEPLPPDDIDGYIEVKNKIHISLAAGESEATRYGFRDLITRHAVDILQPDVCTGGGFNEVQKIITMASAWNTQCSPHVWGTNIAIAAALQVYAVIPYIPIKANPPEPFFEYDDSPNPIRDKTTMEKFTVKNGYLDIPDKPGLGVTVDMDFLRICGT